MKTAKTIKNALIAVLIVGVIGVAMLISLYGKSALAATPTLTLTAGGANSAALTVFGNPNSAINLYYYNQSTPTQIEPVGTVGTTNPSGYFSDSINGSNYGLTTNSVVYVVVNNQTSSALQWPSASSFSNYGGSDYPYSYPNGTPGTTGYPAGTSGTISFSQNNVTIAVGQNIVIYGTNANTTTSYNDDLYLANNASPSIATASASGDQVSVTGQNYGTDAVTVCGYNSSGCGTIYVNVQSGAIVQPTQPTQPYEPPTTQPYQPYPISFNQNNFSMYVGQNATVMLSGGTTNGTAVGSYFISANSGSADVTTTLNGATLTIYAEQPGSVTLTVCSQAYTSDCSYIYLTVYQQIVEPIVPSPVTIMPPVIEPVAPPVMAIAPLSFSQSSVYLSAGETSQITLSGTGSYYISNNSNSLAINAALNGNTITVYAVASGSGTLTVCEESYGQQCGLIAVTVASNVVSYYPPTGYSNTTSYYPTYPTTTYYPASYATYPNEYAGQNGYPSNQTAYAGYTQYPPYPGNTFADHVRGLILTVRHRMW